MKLQEYKFTIEYIKSLENVIADICLRMWYVLKKAYKKLLKYIDEQCNLSIKDNYRIIAQAHE